MELEPEHITPFILHWMQYEIYLTFRFQFNPLNWCFIPKIHKGNFRGDKNFTLLFLFLAIEFNLYYPIDPIFNEDLAMDETAIGIEEYLSVFTKFNPENKEVLTYGESLAPAMYITSMPDAFNYMNHYVDYLKTNRDPSRHGDVLQIAKSNLKYYSGYYDKYIQDRVAYLFRIDESDSQ